jgi:hypothetical protein
MFMLSTLSVRLWHFVYEVYHDDVMLARDISLIYVCTSLVHD